MDNTKETKETDLNRGNKAGSVDMFIRDVNESKYPNATEARKALRHWTWLTRTEADDVKEYIDQHFKVGAHAPRVKTRTKSANVPSRDQDTGPCADENSKKEPDHPCAAMRRSVTAGARSPYGRKRRSVTYSMPSRSSVTRTTTSWKRTMLSSALRLMAPCPSQQRSPQGTST